LSGAASAARRVRGCDAIAANTTNTCASSQTLVDEDAQPFHNGALRRQLLHSTTAGLKELDIGLTEWESEVEYEAPNGFRIYKSREVERQGDDDDELTGLLTICCGPTSDWKC
jgi:hypothetical protein